MWPWLGPVAVAGPCGRGWALWPWLVPVAVLPGGGGAGLHRLVGAMEPTGAWEVVRETLHPHLLTLLRFNVLWAWIVFRPGVQH